MRLCGASDEISMLMNLHLVSKKNPYDLRIPCKDPNGVCYEEVNWITEWMNQPDVKRALGVDHSPVDKFVSCNMTTNLGFYTQGQAMHNSAALLPELIKADIRLLAFAGDTGTSVRAGGLCYTIEFRFSFQMACATISWVLI